MKPLVVVILLLVLAVNLTAQPADPQGVLDDSEEYSPLVYATAAGKIDEVRRLLDKGEPIDDRIVSKSQHLNGATALWVATQIRNEGIFRLLLERGANPNTKSTMGYSALHLATGWSREFVAILLKAGAAISVADRNGMTPLIVAAHNGDNEIVLLLLENGANLRDVDHFGANAMIAAASSPKPSATRVMDTLADRGLSFDSFDDYGRSVLHAAMFSGVSEIIDHVSQKAKQLNRQEFVLAKNGDTPLHMCVREDDNGGRFARELIKRGADIESRNAQGDTPLIVAVRRENIECVRAMLDGGASCRARTPDHMTALHWAALEGNELIMTLLLQHGADPKAQANHGERPADFLINRGNRGPLPERVLLRMRKLLGEDVGN